MSTPPRDRRALSGTPSGEATWLTMRRQPLGSVYRTRRTGERERERERGREGEREKVRGRERRVSVVGLDPQRRITTKQTNRQRTASRTSHGYSWSDE